MAKQNQTETVETTEADKPKRKQLTAAERVAKLEAELEAARKKAEERENKQRKQAEEKLAKINERIAKLQSEADELVRIIGA